MKYIFEIKTDRASIKGTFQEAGFKLNKDLTTSVGGEMLYAILDDEAMNVSYFNSVSEEKTGKYRYIRVSSARMALLIALRIAKKISMTVSPSGIVGHIWIGGDTAKDNWDSLFNEKNNFGRNMQSIIELAAGSTLMRDANFDKLFPNEDLVPKSHSIVIISLFYDRNAIGNNATSIPAGIIPRSITIKSMNINSEEELFGCGSNDLAVGLKSEDISASLETHLASRLPLQAATTNGLYRFVVIKGKKETVCVPFSKFLDALDIPEKLFFTTVDKLGIKAEHTKTITLDLTPNMISRHTLGKPAVLWAVKLENLLKLKVFHVKANGGEAGAFENVSVK